VTFVSAVGAIFKSCKEIRLRRNFSTAAAIVAVLCGWLPFHMAADPSEAAHNQGSEVGKVNFPTHCSQSAQSTIERGLALLHSFEYEEASAAFRNAAELDPACAPAYWGKAMALYEPLWNFPNTQTLALGRQDVAEAQKLGVKDPRIDGYIEAAAAFYQPTNLTPLARLQAYSSVMEKLYREQPEDNEAGELYALSLIALAQTGTNDLANRDKAIAILNPIFRKYPDNPGAAHYLIHATDVRDLAPQGLAAARVYAKIAPDSAHALHMPSHIFRRLGMWREVVDSNLASAAAAEKATKAHPGDADYQLHAMDFLDYAYLESGQEAKARQIVAALKNILQPGESDVTDAQSRFSARNAIELQLWKEAASLDIPKERLVWQDYTYWARAIGSARSGDIRGARDGVQKLIEIAQTVKMTERQHHGGMSNSGMGIDPSEAAGWLAYAEGKPGEALRILRSAADREELRDDEPFATPAREMLADLLLELQRPAEALASYKEVLKNFPGRFNALWGAARAADALGDAHAVVDFYAKLIANCPSDADRPELEAARNYLAAHRN
jgi:tetratricopeptide (TPR) repeat protein